MIDREIDESISPGEREELEQLQQQMLEYRRSVAPLPLDDLRQLHQELLRRASEKRE